MTKTRRLIKVAEWTALTLFVVSLALWVIAANWLIVIPLMSQNASQEEISCYIGLGIIGYGPVSVDEPFVTYWIGEQAWYERPTMHPGSIPAWYLPALTLPVTAVLFIMNRRRRIPPGHCRCGYNLTGNVSGVCPECGTEIATVKS